MAVHVCDWAARAITLRSMARLRIRMTLTVKNQIIGGKFAAIAGPQPLVRYQDVGADQRSSNPRRMFRQAGLSR